MELSKGANTPLPSPEVRITVAADTGADLAALLLTAAGKVRSDSDFVFYNQPVAPGVEVVSAEAVRVSFASVPAEIDRIVLTASLDGTGPTEWGQAGPPRTTVTDESSGALLAAFTPTGLGPETALIACELYRRGDGWKVRAVGQGYAQGLAGIATDFGITVDDEPAEGQSPPPAEVQPVPPAEVRSAPTTVADPPRFGRPTVDLSKGHVTLRKSETVSLTKPGAPALTRVRMGLGWDPATHGGRIDLDASVIAYDDRAKKLTNVWFLRREAFDGAIKHSGDNLTGHGDGDDEVITVDLTALPPEVYALIFTVNSFAGHKFDQVGRAHCRLLDDHTGAELVRFELSKGEPTTGVFLAMLTRAAPGWNMTALGEYSKGATVRKMVDPGKQFVSTSRASTT
ncbi:TerD family protein [Nocardia caishijiensis]|uniref:Stress response protein SCP2 n=1 Tax=Nocardia caishijiensis TaxID=184756 RepID=A0ABQ6YSM5_9NOCA|nr:TerD family protein [Nocardia caishijiensis]KAF0848812.1 stress response protein SCP2 [Nocardia caishijiensis]